MSMEFTVLVRKWGSSLAVRLPDAVVDALDLKDGDEIDLKIADGRETEISRDGSREAAIEQLRKLRRPLPAGFKFDRHPSEQP
jgi:antitoxin MazE